jgi:hypothetical protein
MTTPPAPTRQVKTHEILRATTLAVSLTAALGVNAPRSLTNRELIAMFATLPVTKTTVGPLVISVQSEPARGQALVNLQLSGTTILTQLLCLVDPVLSFDLAQGDSAATGRITLQLLEPPRYSSVDADMCTRQGVATDQFKGMLDSWVATASPVIGDFVAILTSEFSTRTTVRGPAANLAEFQFYQGTTPIAQAEVTQFAPVQVFPDAIVSGGVRIEPGAQITLSIPSTITPGWLFLQATFSSTTTPPTRISSSVANWSLPTLT